MYIFIAVCNCFNICLQLKVIYVYYSSLPLLGEKNYHSKDCLRLEWCAYSLRSALGSSENADHNCSI